MKKWMWDIALAAFLWSVVGSAVQAMEVVVHEGDLFATGEVRDNDWTQFKNALETQTVKRVVLVNSPGGDLWTGMRVGRLIAEHKLPTVIAGRCISACSVMFMGGFPRSFSDAFPPSQTYVGIHGPHSKHTKQVDTSQSPQIYAFFKMRMGEQFQTDVMNDALYTMDDGGALLYVYDPVRSVKLAPTHCRSSRTPRAQCTQFSNHSAISLGLVTASELTKLELPTAMAPRNLLPGGELTGESVDIAAVLEALKTTQCSTDRCRASLVEYAGKPDQKALAFPVQGKGYGAAWSKETTLLAFGGALYACNHPTNAIQRLCQVHLVNSVQIAASTYETQTTAPWEVPAAAYFANEEFAAFAPAFKGLRSEGLEELTPLEVPSLKTWSTRELAAALRSGTALQVLDVSHAARTLPAAQSLPFGGLALTDPARDSALEKRIVGLTQLLAPQLDVPVVVLTSGREDWRAINAAVRLARNGYPNVGWYRGGLKAWREAGLPTVPAVFRAVAN